MDGKPLAISLSLDAVDRIAQDVMRGFGAVPRRGAEVGGILLGKVQTADGLVEIEDYELAPIEYRRGPSYLLSDGDLEAFEETMRRLRGDTSAAQVPVGFFRSNTREAFELGPEDLKLLDRFFPEPDAAVLLIRPHATRASIAGFYFRENGSFQPGPPLGEFPFRLKELAPGSEPSASARRSEPPPVAADLAAPTTARALPRPEHAASAVQAAPAALSYLEPLPKAAAEPVFHELRPAERKRWFWLPLSLIFLLLGVLLGFQAALTLRPQTPAGDPYATGLSITKDGDNNLNVHWDRQAPAVRAARRGLLIIEEGAYNKPLDLDASQLQTGSVIYQHSSGNVHFRFELTLSDRNVLVETLDWKE